MAIVFAKEPCDSEDDAISASSTMAQYSGAPTMQRRGGKHRRKQRDQDCRLT